MRPSLAQESDARTAPTAPSTHITRTAPPRSQRPKTTLFLHRTHTRADAQAPPPRTQLSSSRCWRLARSRANAPRPHGACVRSSLAPASDPIATLHSGGAFARARASSCRVRRPPLLTSSRTRPSQKPTAPRARSRRAWPGARCRSRRSLAAATRRCDWIHAFGSPARRRRAAARRRGQRRSLARSHAPSSSCPQKKTHNHPRAAAAACPTPLTWAS